MTLDFKGGINYLVKTSTAEGADLEVQDFRVEADTSPSTPDSGHLVVLKKSSTHLAPISVLKADGQMLIHLPLDVETIDKATGETVISGSTDPAKYATLVSADQSGNQAPVNAFPPVNQNYVLQEPVSFYTPGSTDPDAQVGTLEAFGAVMNQSA
ncbi:hypothetical protein ACGFX2_32775 [Streptomyces goshikiensis]|uniref:hypothetical protein n=1 Tax=Streptomyces goshikiensis TaxID=1942 RepID=UPI00371096C4